MLDFFSLALNFFSPPESLDTISFVILIALSAMSSFITASIGIGGGMIMLGALAQVLPIKAVIPVHAIIQLGSNSGRAIMLRQHISWNLFAYFALGSVLGAIIGGQFVISLPIELLRALLGIFILYSVWAPNKWNLPNNKTSVLIGGGVTTFLTMFVGATGPFVTALLRAFTLNRHELIASSAAFLVLQHLLKAVVFASLGFVFSPYLGLLCLMIVAGLAGTFLGKTMLLKLNEQRFQRYLKIALSFMALRLLVLAIFAD